MTFPYQVLIVSTKLVSSVTFASVSCSFACASSAFTVASVAVSTAIFRACTSSATSHSFLGKKVGSVTCQEGMSFNISATMALTSSSERTAVSGATGSAPVAGVSSVVGSTAVGVVEASC